MKGFWKRPPQTEFLLKSQDVTGVSFAELKVARAVSL
jgi:hypothetical protein